MHFEIRPGYARQVEQFAAGDELLFARRWAMVRYQRDAGCWKVMDDGTRVGSWQPGEQRMDKPGLTISTCAECGKDFFDRRLEPLCVGCMICVYPGEPCEGPTEPEPPIKWTKAWMRERLGVTGDVDE